MTPRSREIHIHAMAWYFVHISKDVQEMATAFEVSRQTIRNRSKTPAFREALDAFGFTGEIKFGNKAARESDPDVEIARQEYNKAIAEGQPRRAISRAAKSVGKARSVIKDWEKRFNFDRKGQTECS